MRAACGTAFPTGLHVCAANHGAKTADKAVLKVTRHTGTRGLNQDLHDIPRETSSLVACGACFLKLNGALKLDLNTVQAAKKTEFPGPALPGTRLSDANGSGGRPGQRHQQQQRRRRQQQNNGSSKRNATAAAARGHLRKHGTNKRTKAECQLAFLCTHSNNACGTCLCNLHKMVMQCLCTGAGHKQQHHLQNH